MAGVELPVTPLRRQVLFTEPIDGLPAELPFTIDFATSFYFHREGPGLLIGMSDPDERPGFSLETTEDWVPGLLEVASRRAPRIAEAGIKGGWAGLYEVSPDHNAIIGEATGPVAVHLRHRVLRSRVPAGTGGGGDPPRPGAGARRRSWTSRRWASSASLMRCSGPEFNIV